MAITKINTPELLDINTTGAKQLPSGTTAQRPTTGVTAGDFRYNTDDNRVEYYDGTSPYDAAKWFQIDDEALPVACTTDTINYPSGTTNTVYYKMSDATDSTLNGYNGTATDVDFNVQGKFGNAAEFNLSNSKINLPQTYGAEGENFSYSFWFKTTTSGDSIYDSQNIISKRNGANTFHLNITNANTLLISDWSGTMNKQSSTTVTDGVWRNVVFTYSNGSGLVYINGSVETSMSFTVNLPTQSISLGNNIGNWDGNSRNFGGSIDQVRIFSTTLTAANVTSLYNEVQCVPAIIPSDYFNPLLYTGNGSTQSIDDLTFQPDLVWIKNRNDSNGHALFDSVRGAGKLLVSNTTANETGNSGDLLGSFRPLGFQVNRNYLTNTAYDTTNGTSSLNYVAWNWKAGGAPTATNSAGAGNVPTAGSVKIDGADSTTALAGTIAATSISANTESGFSIVQGTTSGGLNTVNSFGHELGVKPELIIVKDATNSGNLASNWYVYESGLGAGKFLYFNDSSSAPSSTYVWGNTEPTSSVFSITDGQTVNVGATFIAYCFTSIPGFSDVGSYIGTGTSGNSIVTGFRPAFLMIKNTTGGSSWVIFDNKRNPSNPKEDALFPNLSSAEYTFSNTGINFLSNGFSLISNPGETNLIGNTYIYLAIAEQVYNANGVTANQTNPFNDGSQVAQYEFEDNADDSQPNGYIGKGGTFKTSQGNIILPVGVYNNAAAGASISFWMKSGGTSYETPIYTRTGSAAAAGWAIRTSTGGNGINWSWQNASGNVVFASGEESVTLTDGWHHVVAIWDGTTSTNGVKLYIDGSLFDELTANATLASQTFTLGPTLGADRQSSGRSILGLDQVRIYNTALNPNDAWLLYSETSATSSTLDYPASTGAIALYELEGDATSTSSSTYDGAATAVAWVPLYDGTDGGTVTYAAPSVSASFLKAGDFNGSSSGINLPSSLNTNVIDATGAFSISMWINANDISTEQYLFAANVSNNVDIGINSNNQGAGKVVWTIYNGSYSYLISTTTITTNTWYYIVATYNNSLRELFINGVSQGTATKTLVENSAEPTLGYRGSQYFNGEMDQVRIFNKALDAGEILQLYNEPNN
jgi:hypothetical protein